MLLKRRNQPLQIALVDEEERLEKSSGREKPIGRDRKGEKNRLYEIDRAKRTLCTKSKG